MKLIDADALMLRLEKKKAGPATERYTDGFNDAIARFRSMVHSEPTKSPLLTEARWKGAGLGDYVCSYCWKQISERTSYCPDCGAKMDIWTDN